MSDKKAADLIEEDVTAIALLAPDFLKVLRVQMLKFAILQLSDEQLAEDAVQEALIGALKNAASFNRRAALKTWVFAILKNKIADILRQRHRMVEVSSLLHEDEEGEDFDMLFNDRGRWHLDERPVAWEQPMESVKNSDFWRVFDTCLNGLPENQARIFMMREFLEFESQEICEIQELTVSNLHVILYRARMRLRECLEHRWFQEDQQA